MAIENSKQAYEIGVKGGRPSKYRGEDTLRMLNDYLEVYQELGHEIPSIAGLSRYIGVSKAQVFEWRHKHPEWEEALDALLSDQEIKLIGSGLSGKFNSTITKLVLSKHGYSDKQEISGPDGKPVEVETWNLVGVKAKDDSSDSGSGEAS